MVENIFKEAGKSLSLCELFDHEGNTRLVEPYMIYTSTTGKCLFHCYQISGYSKSEVYSGWKNPRVDSFDRASVVESRFVQRDEYNPFNITMFPVVHFAITTRDGRTRL